MSLLAPHRHIFANNDSVQGRSEIEFKSEAMP